MKDIFIAVMMQFLSIFYVSPGVSITFLVSGWFCEVGGCGEKGAVRNSFNISSVQEEAKYIQKKDYLIFWLFC